MCGPDDRNRYGRRPRRHGEAVRNFNRDGRGFSSYDRYDRDGDCCRPENDWRYERRDDFRRNDEGYLHQDCYEDYEDEACCCCEEDGPAMLAGLAEELDAMVDEVMGDLVREKMKRALEARLGDKLDRLVEAVVDSHIEDLDDLLNGRREKRPDLIEKFAEILLEDCAEETAAAESGLETEIEPAAEPPATKKGGGRKKKK